MAKIKPGKKPTLIELMEGNDDLASERADAAFLARAKQELVADPAAASAGSIAPELDTAVTALLVMDGAQARWVWNFWLVLGKDGRRAHVSAAGDLEEWRKAINDLNGGGFG